MTAISRSTIKSARALAVGDNPDENASVLRLLHEAGVDCEAVEDLDEAHLQALLVELKPNLLVFSFWDIVKAEKARIWLRRAQSDLKQDAATAVLLCRAEHKDLACKMCMERIFENYLIARPLQDPCSFRLVMRHALERLKASGQLNSLRLKMALLENDYTQLRARLRAETEKGVELHHEYVQSFESLSKQFNHANNAISEVLADAPASEAATVKRTLDAILESKLEAALSHWRQRLANYGVWLFQFSQWATESIDAHEPQARPEPELPPIGPKPILVVDDNHVFREMLCRMLSSAGYASISAEDGEEALEILAREKTSLVLLDLKMPKLDGKDTLTRLKGVPELAQVPVIMLTGQSDRDVVKECIRAGASDYIVKPSTYETIMRKVQAQLNGRK